MEGFDRHSQFSGKKRFEFAGYAGSALTQLRGLQNEFTAGPQARD